MIYCTWMLYMYKKHFRPLSTAVKVKFSIMLRQLTDKIFTQLLHLPLSHLVYMYVVVNN